MSDKFEYQFDSVSGIFFKNYNGEITLEDITSSWEYIFKNSLIPKEIKGFIVNYKNAILNMKINEYEGIVNFYKNNLDVFGNYKIAVITTNPRDIVIPILVESKDNGYQSKPFSTIKAAMVWVLN